MASRGTVTVSIIGTHMRSITGKSRLRPRPAHLESADPTAAVVGRDDGDEDGLGHASDVGVADGVVMMGLRKRESSCPRAGDTGSTGERPEASAAGASFIAMRTGPGVPGG